MTYQIQSVDGRTAVARNPADALTVTRAARAQWGPVTIYGPDGIMTEGQLLAAARREQAARPADDSGDGRYESPWDDPTIQDLQAFRTRQAFS
jgi:hypothetical protein